MAINGWSCCMGNVSAASNPTPALPHGGRGPFGLCFGHRRVFLWRYPLPSTPRAPRKMQTHFALEPARCGLRPAGEGLWFTYTWSAQVFVSGWSCCMGNVSAASNPTPALPHRGGAVRRTGYRVSSASSSRKAAAQLRVCGWLKQALPSARRSATQRSRISPCQLLSAVSKAG